MRRKHGNREEGEGECDTDETIERDGRPKRCPITHYL
jgi:hypothetical protein